jgi:hypothetical protein
VRTFRPKQAIKLPLADFVTFERALAQALNVCSSENAALEVELAFSMETDMAKARKLAAKAKGAKRTTRAVRKLKARSRPQRKSPRKRTRQGVVDRMKSAVQTVVDVAQESAELRAKMKGRGGLSEG